MLATPMDVLMQFPVRRSKKQKQDFRDAVHSYVTDLGYECREERGLFGSCNLVIGNPQNARYLVTAHYDTCARMLLPNLLTPFNPVLYVLYQLLLAVVLLIGPTLLGFAAMVAAMIYYALYGIPGDVMGMAAYGLPAFLPVYTSLSVLSFLLVYFGPANKHNANDNTSGVVTVLEIARTLPENQRHKVCFVLFDLEEKGLWGSSSYRKAHKEATDRQLILNLDCVGDGDHIRLFPTKKLKKERKMLTSLYKACGYFGKKSILVHEKGFGFNPSDQKHFPNGVGICALRKNKFGYYLGRIHTKRDTILDGTNINILRAALTTFICCDEVNEERKMKK